MIAALDHSRMRGSSPNKFIHDEIQFGWEAIQDMLAREVSRIKRNELPRVPGLKESYVHRDPWTRLNVKPAKIMQVLYLLHNVDNYSSCSTLLLYSKNMC